jgi:hypothetical protein
MRIEVYRATDFKDVPPIVYVTFDGMDDRYFAAFDNYPDAEKLVVVGWATTGEVDGDPIAVLIATAGHIITGYVDTYFDHEIDPADFIPIDEDDDPTQIAPIDHDEPPPERRRAALLARLRKVSKATWLLVHDADEVEGWTEHGFRVVEPPPDVPADEALLVLAWGELPEDPYALLEARGLSWHLGRHRYPSRYANE